jgi:acetyltransferase
VVGRPVRPEDEPLFIKRHAGHSERTIRMRFFSAVKTLSRDRLIRLCHLDDNREMALAAEFEDAGGKPYSAGVSRYYLSPRRARRSSRSGSGTPGRGAARAGT